MRFGLRPSGPLFLAGVLASLLLLLASLQWRWLGQISADERDRMQTGLRTQVRHFTQEFDRELTRAYFWLQADRGPMPTVPAADSVEHFERWYSTAPHPELVRSIHVVSSVTNATDERVLTVSTYDRARALLVVDTAPPAALAPIVERLRHQPTPTAGTAERGSAKLPQPVQSDGPALVIPRPPVPVTINASGAIVFSQTERPWDFTIALLDMDYIRATLLPDLLRRQFGDGQASSYIVSVVDLRTGAPVFCSDPERQSCAMESPDASEEFFEIRFREFNRFVVVDDRRHQGRAAAAAGSRPPPADRVAANVVRQGADGDRRGEREPLWRADFGHQAGSLEAVVASTRRRNLFVSSSVLLLLGASIGMLVVSTTRARRLAAQQMEFVAGVSHELRTPLAVIRSAGENLADGVVGDHEQVRRYGQLIAGEGRRLTEMVEQVMEFAGFDAGRPLDLRPVRAVDVAQAAIDASGPLLVETGVHVELEAPAGTLFVLANQPALVRSVQNLISNAVKYGGQDRWVGLRVAAADKGMVAFRIADHGPGIPEQDLPRIFEPFYRGQPAIDGHVHGSGLGLSLVSRIAGQHDGRVTVDTTVGRGTTFTLLIPSAPEATAPATAEVSLPAAMGPAWKRGSGLS